MEQPRYYFQAEMSTKDSLNIMLDKVMECITLIHRKLNTMEAGVIKLLMDKE